MSELDEIERITDPASRSQALGGYITRAETAKSRAVRIRRQAIREVLADHGPAETARLCGVSVSLVKAARGGDVR